MCFRDVSFCFAGRELFKGAALMKQRNVIVTNNPLVSEKRPGNIPVEYLETDYMGVLKAARDKIHSGAVLLTHPLYGSVKPGETPYRSLLIREGGNKVDLQSLSLIEAAMETCRKFTERTGLFGAGSVRDFQVVDLSLLMSALGDFRESGQTFIL